MAEYLITTEEKYTTIREYIVTADNEDMAEKIFLENDLVPGSKATEHDEFEDIRSIKGWRGKLWTTKKNAENVG